MRTLTALLLLALIPCRAEVPDVALPPNPPLGSLIAERGVVLPDAAAPELFKQMSRPAPVFGGKLWTPTAEDIASLESSFPQYFERISKVRHLSLDFYYRQYAGFVTADGRRLIYANFLPWATPSEELQKKDPVRFDPNRWKKSAWIVGDGGGRYFGVVFDPSSSQFSDLEKNGF